MVPAPAAIVPVQGQINVQHEVNRMIAQGWNPVSASFNQTILEKKADINNVLHAVLTLLFCGLWAIPWVIILATSKTQRATVSPSGIYITNI